MNSTPLSAFRIGKPDKNAVRSITVARVEGTLATTAATAIKIADETLFKELVVNMSISPLNFRILLRRKTSLTNVKIPSFSQAVHDAKTELDRCADMAKLGHLRNPLSIQRKAGNEWRAHLKSVNRDAVPTSLTIINVSRQSVN